MSEIKRNNPTPFYLQLEEIIRKKINNGEYENGDSLPSESKLQEKYNLSRTTVRQAMSNLVKDGIITRQRGKGTFVSSKNKTKPDLSLLNSFTEEVKREGKKPGSKVLNLKIIKAPQYISEALKLSNKSSVVLYERIRTIDDKPVGIHTVYLNLNALPKLNIEDLNKDDISLYNIIENKLNIKIGTATETIKAIAADKETSETLNIQEGEPLFSMKRITYTGNNIPFEYAKIIVKGDEFEYKTKLKR